MHSEFSADSDTPTEAMVKASIQAGLKEIAFTEHIDYEYPDTSIVFDLDIPAYTKEINRLRTKYKDQITIKKGVELGLQPYLVDRYKALMKKENFDFVIASVHAADKKDLHSLDFFQGKTTKEAYEIYYQELLDSIKQFKAYNILGHLDLVKRYKPIETDDLFHDLIAEIFRVIIPEGKGIEINASGYAYGMNAALPSDDILALYKSMGGEIITMGSDAHIEKHVAHRFDEVLDRLKGHGFKYISTFTDMKVEMHDINKLNYEG